MHVTVLVGQHATRIIIIIIIIISSSSSSTSSSSSSSSTSSSSRAVSSTSSRSSSIVVVIVVVAAVVILAGVFNSLYSGPKAMTARKELVKERNKKCIEKYRKHIKPTRNKRRK